MLGQNVNAYNFEGKKLSNLIYEISKINELKRIRYTTSHPVDFSQDLIDIYNQTEKLMPLIHLPVQSGSNNILRNMNRKHTIEEYLNLVDILKKVNSSIKFSSDFIIGYPGETDKDFKDTLNLLKKVQFINSYSFIFSPRPGTPAFKMSQIDHNISKKRLLIFQKTAEEIKIKYRKSLFGKKLRVLFENRSGKTNQFFGRDEYSNSVIAESNVNLKGEIKNVKIIKGNHNTLFGEVNSKIGQNNHAA